MRSVLPSDVYVGNSTSQNICYITFSTYARNPFRTVYMCDLKKDIYILRPYFTAVVWLLVKPYKILYDIVLLFNL